VHPATESFIQRHAEHDLLGTVLYLMCDDLPATVKTLEARSIRCTEILKAEWGITTTVRLPSGGQIGLYQPGHPTALELPRTPLKP